MSCKIARNTRPDINIFLNDIDLNNISGMSSTSIPSWYPRGGCLIPLLMNNVDYWYHTSSQCSILWFSDLTLEYFEKCSNSHMIKGSQFSPTNPINSCWLNLRVSVMSLRISQIHQMESVKKVEIAHSRRNENFLEESSLISHLSHVQKVVCTEQSFLQIDQPFAIQW